MWIWPTRPSAPSRGSIRSTTWSPATSPARSAARSTTSAARSSTRSPSRSPRPSACSSTCGASTAPPENIAAALHPAVDADSRLAEVKAGPGCPGEGPDGPPRRRRLPHPDAGRRRLGAPAHRAHAETRRRQPPPRRGRHRPLAAPARPHSCWTSSCSRPASISVAAWSTDGDIPFHLALAEAGQELDDTVERVPPAQPDRDQVRVLGRGPRRRHRPRDRRAVPLQGDPLAQGARRPDQGRDRPGRRGEAPPAPPPGRAAPPDQAGPAQRHHLLPRQRPQPG